MIVVPYVPGMLHDHTQRWAETCGGHLVELDSDDESYFRLLAGTWRGIDDDEPLVIVEQDMLPAPRVVGEMVACPRPWCASPYTIGTGTALLDGLGCTKFDGRLRCAHPHLMDQVGAIDNDGLPARNWRRLDTRLSGLLRSHGYTPHEHAASVHLHDYTASRPARPVGA